MSDIVNPKPNWRLLGVHKHVAGASIREYVDKNSQGWVRRYTATIRGFQNWFIGSGVIYRGDYKFEDILNRVREIRDRIDQGDGAIFQKDAYQPVVDKPGITQAEIDQFELQICSQFKSI